MDSGTATTRAVQAQQTRELLVRTAKQLFAERGYDATSLQAIADEVGLTKAAVYYHYKTKAELLEAVADETHQQLMAIADETSGIKSRTERVGHLVDAIVEFVVDHRHKIELNRGDPALRREKRLRDDHDALHTAMLRALYGKTPSIAEQAAYHLISNIADVVAEMSTCSDGDLRSVLRSLCRRVLTVPD